jgi:hypothetical protein
LPSSQHAAALQEEVDRVRRSNSIQAIDEDPTLADDDLVDATISNYRITRTDGAAATGQATIVVSELATVSVPNGAIFEANGLQFTSDAAYIARTASENVLSDTDRLLTSLGDGNYAFQIDVTAVEEGVAGQISKDTVMVPQVTLANFVRAYATSDFTGGTDEETNSELVDRASQGLTAQALCSRSHMTAMLAEEFPTVVTSSIIGFGDDEMVRDQHSILPVSLGGRADWYVRTQQLPQKLGLTKTATLVSITDDNRGIWQIGIGRDEAPGYYDVYEIKLPGTTVTSGFAITSETRTMDVTEVAGELTPDIQALIEGTFSRYQASVVQFKDTTTDTSSLSVGATQTYSVTVRAMENIDAIQTLVNSRENRNHGGDVLVRAAVPCFLSVSFIIQGQQGETLPDPSTVGTALASYVNNIGFNGRLHASSLSDVIHNYLTGTLAVASIDMNGEILRPDGSVRRIRSSDVIVIPSEPENMVTSRTVVFILDPDDVRISAQTVNIPEI